MSSSPQDDADSDESSGITTLRPVPVKQARSFELAESDGTQYFSAAELLERGKALAAHASEPASPLVQEAPPPTPAALSRSSFIAQFRQASALRKASALLLPLLCVLLLVKPLLKRAEPRAAREPSANIAAKLVAVESKLVAPPQSPPASEITLPRGVTMARAAADSVATGDFSRALALYRELARREPENRVYAEAARILSERAQVRTP